MNPQISIIVPTFNRGDYIQQTLQSVLNQTFKNWECYIIDDGSTDQTVNEIKNFIKEDSRFTLLNRPQYRRKGASTCRNIGLEHAKGEYIQFLDSDDLISKTKLGEQIALLETEDDFTIATTKWGRFEKELVLYDNMPSYRSFNNVLSFLISLQESKGYFPCNSYLISKKLIDLVGPWNEYLSLNDDGEFMMRILVNCKKISFASCSIAWYRNPVKNNVSRVRDFDSFERAVYSWKMIEVHLLIRFGNEVRDFLEWIKNGFYINVKKYQPLLIEKYPDFFCHQIQSDKKENHILQKIKKKLNSWLNRKL